ncbi:MAG: hypothetical protein GY953_35165, partial [bacterium]|nr:hypothetical protein [bacterium]
LDVTVDGVEMGQVGDYTDERRLEARVHGTAPIDEVAIIKNGELVHTHRAAAAQLGRHAWVQIAFESDSEPYFRDNPRAWRRWTGSLQVRGAQLQGIEAAHLENRYIERAEIDPADKNRANFHIETRGRADLLLLELDGASRSTEVVIQLDETTEYGASPPNYRGYKTIPAATLRFPFHEVQDGVLARRQKVDRQTDTIELQLVNESAPLDQRLTFVDTGKLEHGDYYYVRVKQMNGARAYSSPIWIGGEPPR